MNKCLSFLLAMLLGGTAFAQPRSEEEAIEIATEFFSEHTSEKPLRLKVVSRQQAMAITARRNRHRCSLRLQPAAYYIVNDEAGGRFAIVSADQRMYEILGYSDSGIVDSDSLPEGLLDVLGWYDRQMEALSETGIDLPPNPKRASVKPIAPLLSTKWGQESPYNDDCPTGRLGNRYASGCVATAMAQVMNHHQYPLRAQGGIVSYTSESASIQQTMDFDAVSFDWSRMLDSYSLSSPSASKAEVAKLMHACGVSVYMDYGMNSGTQPGLIPYAVIHHFGYNPNTQHIQKDFYSSDEWNSIIRSELSAGRPLLYGGIGMTKSTVLGDTQESRGGHRFVLDGMDRNGLYHFNFGWTGDCDGYFAIDAINPVQQRKVLGLTVSTTVYDFNESQGMVVGMSPELMGKEEDIFYTLVMKIDTVAAVDSMASLTYQPYCCANKTSKYIAFQGTFGLGVFDKDWQLQQTLLADTEDVGKLHAGGNFNRSVTRSFSFDSQTFREGRQFYVALYAQHADSQRPTLVRTPGGEQDWYRGSVRDGIVVLERKKLIEEGTPALRGDVNADGKVDEADIDCIVGVIKDIQSATGTYNLTTSNLTTFDVNADGKVDVADINAVIRIMKRLPLPLRKEE